MAGPHHGGGQVEVIEEDVVVLARGVEDQLVDGLFEGERVPPGQGGDEISDGDQGAAERGVEGAKVVLRPRPGSARRAKTWPAGRAARRPL
jgi:hypothetical protein